jgi:hypothetical protein
MKEGKKVSQAQIEVACERNLALPESAMCKAVRLLHGRKK